MQTICYFTRRSKPASSSVEDARPTQQVTPIGGSLCHEYTSTTRAERQSTSHIVAVTVLSVHRRRLRRHGVSHRPPVVELCQSSLHRLDHFAMLATRRPRYCETILCAVTVMCSQTLVLLQDRSSLSLREFGLVNLVAFPSLVVLLGGNTM